MTRRSNYLEHLGEPIRHRARQHRDWTTGEAVAFIVSLTALATAIAAAQLQLMTVTL